MRLDTKVNEMERKLDTFLVQFNSLLVQFNSLRHEVNRLQEEVNQPLAMANTHWDTEEEQRLAEEFRVFCVNIAPAHSRTPNAIRSRIKKYLDQERREE